MVEKDGDFVKMDEVLCELETDKATMELNAEQAGVLKIIAAEGATLAIGDVVCSLDTSASAPVAAAATAAPAEAEAPAPVAAAAPTKGDSYAAGHPSPAASKILAEKGIEPTVVSGTGKDGRITKEDALNAQPTPKPTAPATAPASPAATPAPAPGSRGQRRERMSQLRKTVARRLVAVK